MKVNQKILSIPPYISTSWKNVLTLHLDRSEEGHTILIIGLLNGATIAVPHLGSSELDAIFNAHQSHLEQEIATPEAPKNPSPPSFLPNGISMEDGSLLSFPISFGIEGNNMGNLLQHNPEASDSPDLPNEILTKIASLTKAMGFDSSENFPKAEPHCNCMHCQIMRVLHQQSDSQQQQEEIEEEVLDSDLQFRDWDIRQEQDKLYIVTNPLNSSEEFHVYLGSPVGCTCGQSNCEHIRAVLNS